MGHASIASYMTQMRLIGFNVTMNTGEGECLYFSFHLKRGTLDSSFFEVPETIMQRKMLQFFNYNPSWNIVYSVKSLLPHLSYNGKVPN
jgi:hypothetical protein